MTTPGAGAVQEIPWDMVNLLRPFFDKGPDPVGPRLLDFSMLRGAWAASVDSAGAWYDVSGHGHHLTYNGNPTFNYDGLVPYWDLDGTGDYFSRADEPDLDIIGNESYVAAAAQGLTVGGWFRPDAYTVTNQAAVSKLDTNGNQRTFRLIFRRIGLGNDTAMLVSGNGVAEVGAVSGVAYVPAAWTFLVGRFVPGTTIDLWQNGTKYTQAVGVPATLFNSTAALAVGCDFNPAATELLAGNAACCFLCAAALSDTQINVFYHMTKRYFGH